MRMFKYQKKDDFDSKFKKIERAIPTLSKEELIKEYEILKNEISASLTGENCKAQQKTITALFAAIENLQLQLN